jgi:hypothetical protein
MIRRRFQLVLLLAAFVPRAGAADSPHAVRVAMLAYGPDGATGRCFSENFLSLVARETAIDVDRAMPIVSLASAELFEHPFTVMTGEGAFELSESEIAQLRAYLLGGGFLLASAGCTDHAWGISMQRALERALPESALVELPLEHPVFHALFNIRDFVSRKRQPVRISGIELDGRLAVFYSPQGLNDTNEAGGLSPDGRTRLDNATTSQRTSGCCCCDGDELLGAKFINANALVYALVQ